MLHSLRYVKRRFAASQRTCGLTHFFQVFKQYQKSLSVDTNDRCSNIFTSTMGLPCAHVIRQVRNANGSLQLDHFHHSWWLHRPSTLASNGPQDTFGDIMARLQEHHNTLPCNQQRLLEQSLSGLAADPETSTRDPRILRGRGRPQGSTSTRRDPSAFEYVEQTDFHGQRRSRTIRCGHCNEEGHNRRTCPSISIQ